MTKGTIYRAILTKHHDEEYGDMWQALLMFSNGTQRSIDVTDVRGAANEIRVIEEAELGMVDGTFEDRTPAKVIDIASFEVQAEKAQNGTLSGFPVNDTHREGSEP